MRILSNISDRIKSRKLHKVARLMRDVYKDEADVICGYFDLGTEMLDSHLFGKGKILDHIIVIPSNDDNKSCHVNVKANDISEDQLAR